MRRGAVLAVVICLGVAAHGCGGNPTPVSLDMCISADGRWMGEGTCGITSFSLSTANGVTLTDFGSNPSVAFMENPASTEATATGLEILFAPNHSCTITCRADGKLDVYCTNPSGGACDSTFEPETVTSQAC